jgi:dTMP kinase
MLIVFEGIDGSGKSTQAQKTYEWLRAIAPDRNPILTRQPGGTQLGVKVREILLNGGELLPEAEFYLFLADRVQHVHEVIIPALENNQIVICDRWWYSTVVYQSILGGIEEWMVAHRCIEASQQIHPNLTLWIDTEPFAAKARAKGDRMDSKPFELYRQCQNAYCRTLRKWCGVAHERIDGNGTEDEVFEQVKGAIARRAKAWKIAV